MDALVDGQHEIVWPRLGVQHQLSEPFEWGERSRSTELGVVRIVPLVSERTEVRLDEDRAGRRLAHWQRVVQSACEQCGTDLRCCRNCRHWDVRMNNECRETEADPVAEKTRRNFCEFFDYSRLPFSAASAAPKDRAAQARAKLEALFKKPGPSRE